MVEVKMQLFNSAELARFAWFTSELEQARAAEQAKREAEYRRVYGVDELTIAEPAVPVDLFAANTTMPESTTQLAYQEDEPSRHVTFGNVAAVPGLLEVTAAELGLEVDPPAAEVSEKDAVTALEAFLKHGGTVPKAVDLLKSFGVKRVGELASDKRGAFVAALQSTGSIENS